MYTIVCVVLSINVTITSSPQLGVGTVCDSQEVNLMCHADQTTSNMITWYWSNQSQHGDAITVVATLTEIVYTCVASGKEEGKASITVVANGEQNSIVGIRGYQILNPIFYTGVKHLCNS